MLAHPTIVAHLDVDDLRRWRTLHARDDGIKARPSAYSRDEIEECYRQKFLLWGEFVAKYNLIDSPHLNISATAGAMYYMNDRGET